MNAQASGRIEPQDAGPAAENDSFDDDLTWILSRLTERAGAQFGAMVRFVEGALAPLIVATHGFGSAPDAAAVLRIASELKSLLPDERAAADEVLHRRELGASTPSGAIRLLHMRYLLASGVTLVTFVWQPTTAPVLLQDLVARSLHPVLQRYLRLWWMHRSERRRVQALTAVIENSDMALALLDRRCSLTFTNGAADRLLDAADGLRRHGTSLMSSHPGDSVRFQAVLQHALHCNAQGRLLSDYRAPVLALRRSNRRPLLILATPLERTALDPNDAAIIVQVLDPDGDTPQQLAPIFHLYKLTAAEARLVSHLVQGLSLSEAAQAMRVGSPTARGYLKKVFFKTDTNRQAELIRLMVTSAIRSKIGLDLGLM